MILYCQNCSAKFKVPDEAIGRGRKVRCSSCSFEWFQEPSPEMAEIFAKQDEEVRLKAEEAAKAMQEAEAATARLSELRTKKPVVEKKPIFTAKWFVWTIRTMILASLAVLFATVAVVFDDKIMRHFPQSVPLYKAIGVQSDNGLKFTLVQCNLSEDKSTAEEDVEIDIKITMTNSSKEKQNVHSVRFSVLDADHNFLGDYTMPVGRELDPKEEEVIEGKLNRIPKDVAYIIIESGSAFDMFFKSPSYIAIQKKLTH